MRRKISILLVLILVFGVCAGGCGKKQKKETNAKKQDEIERVCDDTVSDQEILNGETEGENNSEQQPVAEENNAKQQQSQNQSENKKQSQQKEQNQSQQQPQKQQNNTQPEIINPTVTASATNISLVDTAQTITITVSHSDVSANFTIADSSVVSCKWGNWNGKSIPLTITPLKTGNTVVTVSLPSYNKSITISVASKVTTPADLSSLTIDKVGGEYKNYSGKIYNVSKVNSAEYIITNSGSTKGMIDITVEVMASMIEQNNGSSDYINFNYELINSKGVCVTSGVVIKKSTQVNQLYTYPIYIYAVAPDSYTLRFSDEVTWKQ